ncbi:mechanosensitive ion channel family protein [Thalassospira alkalitolerans]|uniref:mechanosensitive ion channel family protein n=1 Tax=Thalassospira alkalitolerans TaxID=1293890 RepID=UPI0030EF70A3|tara:strand:+ start:27696 stop:29057 length:1362 start_codon:yes stop_codon:yes gene_type:complete
MQDEVADWLISQNIEYANVISFGVVLALIALMAIILHGLLHRILLPALERIGGKRIHTWQKILTAKNLFPRLAFIVQGVVVYIQAGVWLSPETTTHNFLHIAARLWIIYYVTLTLFSLLDAVLLISRRNQRARTLPLRGIFQGVKLTASILAGLLCISILIGESPIILLSGLGAMTAVLMLVFKDPILGLVAGIQLSANDMLSVGDWLEMPKYGADGDVIDIGLTTVKVCNWDMTITTIPTYALISDSFKNWRNMSQSGGRRIKRSINIDASCITFLSPQEFKKLHKSHLLAPYLDEKNREIETFNTEKKLDLSMPINGRRMTNLGTLRAYLTAYLRNHPMIHQDMTLMVRQLQPGPNGVPLEIYAFTKTVNWLEYEAIQSDIFDHTLAVLPEFGLRIHQTPTGYDMRALIGTTTPGIAQISAPDDNARPQHTTGTAGPETSKHVAHASDQGV